MSITISLSYKKDRAMQQCGWKLSKRGMKAKGASLCEKIGINYLVVAWSVLLFVHRDVQTSLD